MVNWMVHGVDPTLLMYCNSPLDDQRQISRLLLARVHRGNDIGRSADDSDFLLGGFIWKHRQRRVEHS